MLEYSKTSHLLEQHAYRYSLQDVAEPNLYREIYNYQDVPKTPFNHRRVPMNMPEEIFITDTSFRDGQQSQAPYSVEQIVALFKLLNRLGGEKGIIRQTEFFVYSDRDRAAIDRCMDLGFQFPEITTWIRASREDFKLVKNIGIKETGILVSCSDYHIFKKLGMNRSQALDKYLGAVKDAFDAGVRPRCHLEDITRADFYGFVIPFVNELMDMSKEAGIPVKIRACDTMGYGLPYTGVAIPRSVAGIIYGLKHYSDVPSEMLEWHGHNDFYKAVSNAACAWLYGASAVNCSMLGIGERTGNIPLEAMVLEYASLRGTLDGMDPTAITDIARFFKNEIGYQIPDMTPFVGENFNVTKAGIHADGLLKDEEIYNIFNTKKLLGRAATVSISNTSGLAGIAYWINEHYGLEGDQALTKKDPLVSMIKSWIDRQYDQGRETAVSAGEMEDLVKAFAADRFQKKEGADVEKEANLSLADHVFRTLEEEILAGRYENGETLTEARLCESMGVSRTPVREALRRLEQEGLIRMEAGKSAKVLGVTGKDLCDIYDIRMRVEGLAARLAALHAKPEQLKLLEDVVELEEFYTAKGDPDKIRNMDSRFHQMIYEYADNYQLQLMLTDLHHRIQNYRRMSLNAPQRALRMSGEHRQILEDIKRGDADAAERNMTEHIRKAKENLLALLKKDPDGNSSAE